jgi:hypothetical protein
VLKGKLLFVFHGTDNGIANRCFVVSNVEPANIASTLNEKLGFDFRAFCLVMSARQEYSVQVPRTKPEHEVSMGLFCEANTMPKIGAAAS